MEQRSMQPTRMESIPCNQFLEQFLGVITRSYGTHTSSYSSEKHELLPACPDPCCIRPANPEFFPSERSDGNLPTMIPALFFPRQRLQTHVRLGARPAATVPTRAVYWASSLIVSTGRGGVLGAHVIRYVAFFSFFLFFCFLTLLFIIMILFCIYSLYFYYTLIVFYSFFIFLCSPIG